MKSPQISQIIPLLATLAITATTSRASVSNLGSPISGGASPSFTTSGSNTLSTDYSTSFTTGSSDTLLDDITINLGTSVTGTGFTAALYSNNLGLPGSLLLTLNGNATPTGGGMFTYTGSYTLTATTTYWAVFNVPHSGPDASFIINTVGTPNQTGDVGWTLGDNSYAQYGFNGSLGAWTVGFGPARMAVNTSAVPEPSTLLMAITGLFFAGVRRRK